MNVVSKFRSFLGAGQDSRGLHRATILAAVVFTVILLVCHLACFGNAGALWRDEIGTIEFSKMPSVSEIWYSLRYDNFPPLTVFALRAWKSWGFAGTDLGYRAFGLLVGCFLLATMWITAWLLRVRGPFWILLLFGLHPLAITVGDSIRPYGLGIGFIILTFGFVWKVATEKHWRWFFFATLSAVASVQTLYQSAFIILAICTAGFLIALRRSRWKNFWWIAGVGLISALSLLPYRTVLAKGHDQSMVGDSPVPVEGLLSVFTDSLFLAGRVYQIVWICLLGFCLVAAIWTVFTRHRFLQNAEDNDRFCYVSVLAPMSVVLYFGVLIVMHIFPQRWYFLLLQAVLAISIATFFSVFLRTNRTRIIQLLLGVALMASTLGSTWKAVHERRTNIDQAAKFLKQFAGSNDLIVVDPFFYGISFQYYYDGSAPWTMLPEVAEVKIHRFDLLKQTMQKSQPIEPVLKRATDVLNNGGRVWLLGAPKFLAPGIEPETLPPAPRSRYRWMLPIYLHYWSLEASYVLNARATNSSEVAFPGSSFVNSDEDAKLYLFRGSKARTQQ